MSVVISQYANSPRLLAFIEAFRDGLGRDAVVDAVYNDLWNIETCKSFALDIWGRIIGVSRNVVMPPSANYFGFKIAGPTQDYKPFNQAPFYLRSNGLQNGAYALSDEAYRFLLYAKALSNISDTSARSINRVLRTLFAGRGPCYVAHTGTMQVTYVFEFELEEYETVILSDPGIIIKPTGVGVSIVDSNTV